MVGQPNEVVPANGPAGVGGAITIEGDGTGAPGVGAGVGVAVGAVGDFEQAPVRLAHTTRANSRFMEFFIWAGLEVSRPNSPHGSIGSLRHVLQPGGAKLTAILRHP
jgi:hypothetical protein